MPRILKVQLPVNPEAKHYWVHLQTRNGWPEITDQVPELPEDVILATRAQHGTAYFEAEEQPGRRWTFLGLHRKQNW